MSTVPAVKYLLVGLLTITAVLTLAALAAAATVSPSTRDTVVVVREKQAGFSWPDVLIGAGAASGIALVLAGAVLIRGRKNDAERSIARRVLLRADAVDRELGGGGG